MTNEGVPIVTRRTRRDLERIALDLTARFFPACLVEPQPFPVHHFLEFVLEEHFGVVFQVQPLPVHVEAEYRPPESGEPHRIQMQPWVYDQLLRDNGRARYTGAHEICHGVIHKDEVEVELVDGKAVGLRRHVRVSSHVDPEWQADRFAALLLMPADMVRRAVAGLRSPDAGFVARTFRVSVTAASYRLKEIGLG